MANTTAFTYPIVLDTGNNVVATSEDSSTQNSSIVGMSSPTWLLTFVRWEYRDLLRTPTDTPNAVRDPLIVESDCLQVTVSDNKGTLTPNMNAILVETDINYTAAVHPGDFVFVNMLNWEEDARAVATKAASGEPINGLDDGFKGLFKVQGVRRTIRVDPLSGTKTVLIRIDGFAFTEFNNTIYFNPNLINVNNLNNIGLFIGDISKSWTTFVSQSGKPFIQEIIAFLIQTMIGCGLPASATQVAAMVTSPNNHFLVPLQVGQLLGVEVPTALSAKDLYVYLFGIQQYSSSQAQDTATGMNPSNSLALKYPGFYYTGTDFCPGNSLLKPEYWNQVKLWDIINQYTNSPLNEIYTCFRVAPPTTDSLGNAVAPRVMPTLVFRQIPFTSPDFVGQTFGTQDANASTIKVTSFMNVPRWKIGSEMVYSLDLGTDESARVNFVQYYAKSSFTKNGTDIAAETALTNYVYDKDDIARSGLRPYVVQNQFEDLPNSLVYSAPIWARILGDAVMGAHLKLNGTIECVGIVDPIAIGDNLEFDNVVFHIEQIAHTCVINPVNGIKSFRTTISVSHGISVNSSALGTLYSQMTYPNAYLDRSQDYQNDTDDAEQILPGVSESEDVLSRTTVDGSHATEAPFEQPTINKGTTSTGE
jgi:hypothetical protein